MSHATRQDRLRLLLAGGDWCNQKEMQRAGGFRYGARLFDAHNSREPLHYELREGEKPGQFFYRQASKARCSICRNPSHARAAGRIAALESQLNRLRAAAGFGGAAHG